MKDITIIVPIHEFNYSVKLLLEVSLTSVDKCREHYTNGQLLTMIVCPSAITNDLKEYITNHEVSYVENDTNMFDFCSQINYAVDKVETDYFSILEFDDCYSPKWFKMAHDYYYTNEDVSVFLPINAHTDASNKSWQYCNELVWASSFSNELGFIDLDCLENCFVFNLTGGIFNTKDFIAVGKFKPSIKIAFNYEFLMRLTYSQLKVMVVPKEGYYHLTGRSGSLLDIYNNTIPTNDIEKWFDLAKREYTFKEDRNKTIINVEEEVLE